MKKRLPPERPSMTHKFTIDGHKGYLTVGFYEDGSVGEVFLRMAKQGSTLGGFVDSWAIAASMLLQNGVLLTDLIEKFRGVRFEPSGLTLTPEIPTAASPIDYVVQFLQLRFAGGAK